MTSTANTEIALGALLPHLARSHQQEQAFDIATGIADDLQRARVMAHLCPDVTASQRQAMLPELVDVIQNATEAETQLELITSLTPYLKSMSAAEIYACWRAILHSLTNQSRPDLLAGLRALLPILIFLGTVELFESTEEAVQQVGSWWP
jgi:hypothetical protein